MVDKEKQIIAFIDAKKKTPHFEGAVISRYGEAGEYYLQLIETEVRFKKLKEEIAREQKRFSHLTEEEIQVIAFIEARKDVLYFEDCILATFGELGRHCLELIDTDPQLKSLKDDITKQQKRFAALQQRNPQDIPEESELTQRLHYLR